MVPPAYYAHLVAARARFHARGNWSDHESTESSSTSGGGMDDSSYLAVKQELLRGKKKEMKMTV